MKKLSVLLLLVVLGSSAAMAGLTGPKTKEEKIAYVIGQTIGKDFKAQELNIDESEFYRGFKDALAGKAKLNEKEMQELLMSFQTEQMAKQQAKFAAMAEKNVKAGKEFLEKNKIKEAVQTTASGLQYKILKKGSGKSPKVTDTVEVHYVGTLINGKEFDSSYKRNEPATFPVNGVIKGWTEAMQLMHVGDKFQLFIPADLAYGPGGAGGLIGPSETLIFEVELLAIK